MSVTLQVELPSGTLSVSALGKDTIRFLKSRIIILAGWEMNTFALEFEGEELEDDRRVCDYPFTDQSVLQLVVSHKHKALYFVKKFGWNTGQWTVGLVHDLRYLGKRSSEELTERDEKYFKVLEVMCDADLCRDREQMTEVLVEAAVAGLSKCVDLLLKRDLADINAQRELYGGHTALHRAAAANRIDVVRILLAHNADPNIQAGCLTPMSYAERNGHDAVLQLLRAHVGFF
eukprot:TRINITY_DN4733_c0_g2_i1.p1 TRINITY_DN4733_c0_g2~~TRINITY_DN4733_c0_g2_i1.p1  ORF type:complete len:232 (+),score=25.24 TRINITY_DN4733_c0_g2_i1:590-1285(+)